MPLNDSLKLSVIIPTYNRGAILLDTVEQLLGQTFKDFELIIIDQTDNQEYDVSSKLLSIKDARLKLYFVSPNSLTAARNLGMKQAQGEIILYLDDDINVKPDFLQYHVQPYKDDEVVAVAGSVTQKGHTQYNHMVYFDKYGFQHGLFNSKQDGECPTFPGGNSSIRRKVALRAGGYDESFTGSAIREESEFAHRVGAYGKIVYRHKANILHLAVPFGGCRIYSHQFDNFEYYFNDLRFMFKTVKYYYIPVAIVLRFGKTTLQGRSIKNFVKRTFLFAGGLAIAIKRLVLPVHIALAKREVA